MLRRFTPRNDSAFTLAEVLITLVIIGVIAALTIPNLLQKYQEQATVKKVQKFYSTLTNAYSLAVKENGTLQEWGLKGSWDSESQEKIYELLFKPYFKIAKNCGNGYSKACINIDKYYKSLDNTDTTNNFRNGYKLLLDDGSAVIMYNLDYNIYVLLDPNGRKGPNQRGYDLFYFWTTNETIKPFGVGNPNPYNFDVYCQKSSTLSASGLGCAAWVVYKGNMDYLHCDGLTWNSRSCKEK